MSITLNGSGTITGLSAGGLPDGAITTAEIADANVTQAKLETLVVPLGVGQTWQKPTRAAGTTYTNSTGRPITVALSYINTSTTGTTTAYIDGTIYISSYAYASSCSYVMTFVVPSGSTYQIAMTNASVYYWAELR